MHSSLLDAIPRASETGLGTAILGPTHPQHPSSCGAFTSTPVAGSLRTRPCVHIAVYLLPWRKRRLGGKWWRKHVGAMSSAMSSYEWRRANARVGRSLHHYLFKTAGKGELARAQGVISEKKKCSTGCASKVWCVGGQWRQGCRRC